MTRPLPPRRNANRLIAGMWTLAAVLAWTAVGIRYFGSGEMNWTTAAIGFVCIALGLASWKRRTIDGAPTDPRGTPPSP